MRISHRYRFIFFSNPKTGSSSVRRFLDPYTDVRPVKDYRHRTPDNPFYPHITPRETEALFADFGWDFSAYTRFTLVRNPWARLVSLYEHIRRDGEAVQDFEQWLFTIEPRGAGGGGEDWQRWRKYGSYSIEHYVGDGSGQVLVDEVLKLEEAGTVLKSFLSALGLPDIDPRGIPHYNSGGRAGSYASYYSKKAAARVAELYAYDVETYGYEFGAE